MNSILQLISLRSVSIFVGVLALVLPVSWFAYQQWLFAEWSKKSEGPLCGLPFLGALLGAVLLSVVLSFTASCFGVAAFLRLPEPRPWKRFGELFLLSLPFWLGGAFVLAVLYERSGT